MAQEAPSSIDVQDVQFKVHDKFRLFNVGSAGLRSHVDLLSVASSYGMLFAGNPNAAEIKVIILKELVEAQMSGQKVRVRAVPLPNVPNALACSADGSFLAVNYSLNGSAFLQIFRVASFTTPNIKSLYNIRLSPEENVFALHLLWNPVLTASLAVVLSNGALGMYTLKEGGQFELHSLERTHQVRCGCWSPKGKQIVLGFPHGKLQQFKPDLTPAKTIACPAGVHAAPFDTIALHWLSTFQFAAVFLQHGVNESSPALYIVNAPKGGTPTFINYYDICYSANGPRAHQVSFTHIPQWNLLLMTSANGVEVGLLGTKEATDTPTWLQYTLLDEARIEMPLTDAKDETFPIGFAFDTSSAHQLTIGEVKMPVSPMVHVLSTHGHLVSFDFLNLSPGAVGVCSPPLPLTDTSGQFRALEESNAFASVSSGVAKSQEPVAPTTQAVATTTSDMSFGFAPSAVTSTPSVKEKSPPMFGAFAATAAPVSTLASPAMFGQVAAGGVTFGASAATTKVVQQPPAVSFGLTAATASSSASLFGALTNATASAPSTTTGFGGFGGLSVGGGSTTFAGFGAKPAEIGSAAPIMSLPAQTQQKQHQHQQQQILSASAPKPTEINKPLYTVPATFTPPASTASLTPQQQQQQQHQHQFKTSAAKPQMNTGEINEVVKQMISVQINAFDLELKQLANQSKGLLANIGNPNEMKAGTKRLNDLQEIIEQANDREFEQDVQNLRHSLNESYAMLAECRSKLEMYNNPDITRLTSISNFDPVNRRQLSKLQSYLAANQAQMQQLQQQIDAQWSGYQDLVRRNSRKQMHIPCLDGIYQRMTKLKDMVARQRTKLNYIKGKLKQNGLIYKPPNTVDAAATSGRPETSMESLADSILSMSLVHVVDANRSRMSDAKLNAIRNFTRQQQQITIIKPQRPDRVDLKSEVILETKLQSDRRARDGAATSLLKMQQEKLHLKTQQQQQSATLETSHMTQLAKPMATKPAIAAVQPQTSFAPPAQAQMGGAPSFNLGGSSLFVKTSSSSALAPATAVSAANKFGLEEQQPKQPFSIASSMGSTFSTPTFTGFGGVSGNTNTHQQQPLSFGGQPKALIAAKPESLKEALAAPPMQTPISFSPKVIGGGDVAKPFAIASSASSSINASTVSSGFAALTASNATKSTVTGTAATQPPPIVKDKENKKPEEAPKAFSFNPEVSSSVAAPAFGGFAPAVSSAAASTTKTSIFGGDGSGNFSFGGLGSTAASGTSAAAPATFSFGGAVSAASTAPTSAVSAITAPVTTATAKPPMFSGFGKPVGEVNAAKPAATTSSGFNFGAALNLSTSQASTSAPPTSTVTAPKKTISTTLADATVSTTSDPTDSLFGTLNICQPNTAKDAAGDGVKTRTVNAFSGFGDGNAFSFSTPAAGPGGDTSIFAASAAATGSGSFSFGAAASSFGKPAAPTTTITTATATTATSTAATAGTLSTIPSTSTVATTIISTADAPTSTTFSFTAMAGLGTAPAATATNATSSTAPTATAASTLFGSAANSAFGATVVASTVAQTTTATSVAASTTAAPTSIFGGTAVGAFATATSTAPVTTSIFANAAAATVAPVAASAGNIFGSAVTVTTAAPASGGSIFGGGGGIPKPDQSVFANETTTAVPVVASGVGLFAAAAAASSLPFGSPNAAPATSGGSIFGGSATGFGVAPTGTATTGGSIFGGGGAGSATATSPFGAVAANNAGGGSIFGGAAATVGGGSIFGQSAFGAAAPQASTGGSNIFAPTAAQPNAAPTVFGGGGSSLFGGAVSNAASGGSIFGGAAPAPAFGATTSTGFGAFSQQAAAAAPAFGTSNAAASGFAQGGVSVAQSGFGSPPSSAGAPSAFAKPIFGGNTAFGSPPAFGAHPSFGGAPTFGSPKPFGSFTSPIAAAPQPSPFGSPPAQKNNLFEALGSNESGGLSFGNLAQNTNPNAQKPTFGGSSFMNYRA